MYPLSRSPYSLKRFDQLLPELLKPIAKKRGFREASLLVEWDKVVGAEYAQALRPVKISHGRGEPYEAVLYAEAEPHRALELQYNALHILDRINTYFGCRAITTLKILKGQGKASFIKTKPVEPNEAPLILKNATVLDGITCPELKQALEDLGISMGL
jgi:hypothetical protein